MTYFVDTDIFLRYFLNDVPTLSKKAKEIFESVSKGKFTLVTTTIVLAEFVWTLNSFYKLPKEETIEYLKRIIAFKVIKIEGREILDQALTLFEAKNISFIDALSASFAQIQSLEGIFSFDRDFDKILGIKRLESI